MSSPYLVFGADGIPTLLGNTTVSTNIVNAGLNLKNTGSSAGGPALVSASYSPITTIPNPSRMSLNTIFINPTNGRVYRKIQNDGITQSLNYEQVAPYVCCIAQSSAGNLLALANTTYYLDFPTTVYDPMGGVIGAGSGNVTTSGTGWRFQPTQRGYYLVSTIIEYANVASNNTLNFYASGYTPPSAGSQAMSPTGTTINRTTVNSLLLNNTSAPANLTIQVTGAVGVANTAQSAVAVNNKVVIAYMGRSFV